MPMSSEINCADLLNRCLGQECVWATNRPEFVAETSGNFGYCSNGCAFCLWRGTPHLVSFCVSRIFRQQITRRPTKPGPSREQPNGEPRMALVSGHRFNAQKHQRDEDESEWDENEGVEDDPESARH